MADILNCARAIQAICQPMTGERAAGKVTIKAGSVDALVGFGQYLFPVINGSVRYDLAFKTAKNTANAEGNWPIPAGTEVDVDIFSNIGGVRHNLPAGAPFVLDRPWLSNLLTRRVQSRTGTTGGIDPTNDLALHNFVLFEHFGAKRNLELFQSSIGGKFPAALMYWEEGEPADGLTTSGISTPTMRGAGVVTYAELFKILIITSRSDSEHERRAEGLRLVEEVCSYLIDRVSVDNKTVSSPGIKIRRRYRENGGADVAFYKAFQVYAIDLSIHATITKRDTREFELLRWFMLNAPVEDTPDDLPLVIDNKIQNPQT